MLRRVSTVGNRERRYQFAGVSPPQTFGLLVERIDRLWMQLSQRIERVTIKRGQYIGFNLSSGLVNT